MPLIEVEMRRMEVQELYHVILLAEKREDSKYEFNYALMKTRRAIREVVEEIEEELRAIGKEENRLCTEFSDKGADGKPIVLRLKTENSLRVIFQGCEEGVNQAHDKAVEDLRSKHRKYLREVIKVQVHKVKPDVRNEKLSGELLDVLSILETEVEVK
jgi:hypothetical protein